MRAWRVLGAATDLTFGRVGEVAPEGRPTASFVGHLVDAAPRHAADVGPVVGGVDGRVVEPLDALTTTFPGAEGLVALDSVAGVTAPGEQSEHDGVCVDRR